MGKNSSEQAYIKPTSVRAGGARQLSNQKVRPKASGTKMILLWKHLRQALKQATK
jgi:hypothetical protein